MTNLSLGNAVGPAPGLGTDQRCCLTCEVRPISVCGVLAPDELSRLQAISDRPTFAARDTIALQGEPSDVVYNIMSGVARVYSLLADGRRQIVGFLLPGDFFGLALGDRFAFCADAVTPVSACSFRRAGYEAFLSEKPHLLRRLHQAAADEMIVAQNHMILLGRAKAETRVLAFLMNMRERWARLSGRPSVTIPLPMGRADIGDYLGLTIGTTSRTLNDLARQKLIVIVPNGVRLLEPQAIQALVAAG